MKYSILKTFYCTPDFLVSFIIIIDNIYKVKYNIFTFLSSFKYFRELIYINQIKLEVFTLKNITSLKTIRLDLKYVIT